MTLRLSGLACVALGLMVLSGCAIAMPQTQFYILTPKAPAPEGAPAPVSVGFDGVQLSQVYSQDRIAYRKSDNRIAYFNYENWAAAPDLLVGEAVFQWLSDSGRFQRVEKSPSLSKFDVVVDGQLRDIYEDERAEPWQAVLSVAWEIRDGATDKVLGRTVTTDRAPVEGRTVDALARAMSRAVEKSAEQLAAAIVQATEKHEKKQSNSR
ncbi:MAG: ABC-type transport auxiliary lipoprotein family protein [Candidatus Sumerlaeota bacterium]|nr:ABC-type transport auxiliary lipoprotein family protein [Candidatus Sumerlaeota bacterium]